MCVPDKPANDDDLPGWLWRVLLLVLVIVLVFGGGLSGLLAAGLADVSPYGGLLWHAEAGAGACLDVNAVPDELPPLPLTVILGADVTVGGSAWGLWIGQDTPAARWEVLPPGYYRHDGVTWPFFHVGGGDDKLRLDLTAAGYTLWLNQERAVAGPLPSGDSMRWGLVGGQGVCWRHLALYGSD